MADSIYLVKHAHGYLAEPTRGGYTIAESRAEAKAFARLGNALRAYKAIHADAVEEWDDDRREWRGAYQPEEGSKYAWATS